MPKLPLSWLAPLVLAGFLSAIVFAPSAGADELSGETKLIDLAPGRARIVARRELSIYFDGDGISNNNSWVSQCIGWKNSGKGDGKILHHLPAIHLQPGDFLSVDATNAADPKAQRPQLELTVHKKDGGEEDGFSFSLYCVHTYFALVASSDVKTPAVSDLVRTLGRRVVVESAPAVSPSGPSPAIIGEDSRPKRMPARDDGPGAGSRRRDGDRPIGAY